MTRFTSLGPGDEATWGPCVDPADPRWEEDDRDVLEMTPAERKVRYRSLSHDEMVELVECAIDTVTDLRRQLAALKYRKGK